MTFRALASVLMPACVSLVVVSPALAAAVDPQLGIPAPRERLRTLADEENWKALCTSHAGRRDTWDGIKCIPLARDPNRYLSVGGDVRLRYEHYFNKLWNPALANTGYLLQRDRMHFDLHESRLRTFAEFEHASASGAPFDPIIRNDFATTAAYVEYGFGGSTDAVVHPFAVKIGRQQVAYGSNRMLDNRLAPNTVQAFDGLRLRYRKNAWQSDLLYTRPVVVGPYGFDDAPDQRRSLFASYTTYKTAKSTFDFYGIVDQRGSETTVRGTSPSIRDTVGVRFARSGPHLDTDVELAKQFGSFGPARIDAYSLSSNSGYAWKRGPHAYRFGMVTTLVSGDHDPKGAVDTQFRAPYEIGLLFGIVQANGTSNISGFSPSLTYTYHDKTTFALRDYQFFRSSRADGIYAPNGSLLRGTNGSRAASIGNLEYASINHVVDSHLSVNVAYAKYNLGAFLLQSGPAPGVGSQAISLFATALQYQF